MAEKMLTRMYGKKTADQIAKEWKVIYRRRPQ